MLAQVHNLVLVARTGSRAPPSGSSAAAQQLPATASTASASCSATAARAAPPSFASHATAVSAAVRSGFCAAVGAAETRP